MATRFSQGSLEINISLGKLSSVVEPAARRSAISWGRKNCAMGSRSRLRKS
jgi:hypothetical protein